MRLTIQRINLLADRFLKEAGVIKVPDKLVNNISEYMISVYSNFMFKRISEFETIANKRNHSMESIQESIQDWYQNIELLKLASWDEDGKYIDKIIDIYSKEGYPRIPYLDNSEAELGMNGKVELSKTGISFSITETAPNQYWCDCQIDIPNESTETEGNRFQVDNTKYNLSVKGVSDWLKDVESQLRKALSYINETIKDFDIYGESNLSRIDGAKEFFEKHEVGYSAASEGKTFSVPVSELPYPKELPKMLRKFSEIRLHAQFVPNKKLAKSIYKNEHWAGLWVEREMIRTAGKIGSIYVSIDIDDELPKIAQWEKNYPEKITERFDYIRDTVRHEVQHLIQTFIQQTTPRDIPELITDLKELKDSIDQFNGSRKLLPVYFHPAYAKAWVGKISYSEFEKQLVTDPNNPIITDPKLLDVLSSLKKYNTLFINIKEEIDSLQKIRRHERLYRKPAEKGKLEFLQDLRNKYDRIVSEFFKQILPKESVPMIKRKLRDPRYDESGHKYILDSKGRKVLDDLGDAVILQHTLRDVEFHTDLTDSISNFNRAKSRVPVALHPFFARAWVGLYPVMNFKHEAKNYVFKLSPDEAKNFDIDRACQEADNKFFRELRDEPKKQQKAIDLAKSVGEGELLSRHDLAAPQRYQHRYNKAVSEFFKAIGQ